MDTFRQEQDAEAQVGFVVRNNDDECSNEDDNVGLFLSDDEEDDEQDVRTSYIRDVSEL